MSPPTKMILKLRGHDGVDNEKTIEAQQRKANIKSAQTHLENLLATEEQARNEGEIDWSVHVLMIEEVKKLLQQYEREDMDAQYHLDKKEGGEQLAIMRRLARLERNQEKLGR